MALNAGHDVWVLSRNETYKTRRKIPDGVHRLTCDVHNPSQMKEVLKNLTFDVVIDFICYTEDQAKFDVELFKDKTKQFIFISSVTVYKRLTKYLPFKEDCPKWELSDYNYALDKVKCEKVFMDAHRKFNFPITIVRPAHTYDTIIPVPLGHNCFTAPQRYIDGKAILIAGDGTNLWTLTHSKDFARAVLGLLGNSKAIGEAFHITGDEWLTWLDITEILLNSLGVANPKYIHIPFNEILNLELPVSKNMSISYLGKAFKGQRMWCDIYDNSKIKSFVPTWKQEISFDEGIKETIAWVYEDTNRIRINEDLNNVMNFLEEKFR